MERLATDKLPESRIVIGGPFGDIGTNAKRIIEGRSDSDDLPGGIVKGDAFEVFALPEPIHKALQSFVVPSVKELFDALLQTVA